MLDGEVEYSAWLRRYKSFLTGDPVRDRTWHHKAQEGHARAVVDALLAIQFNAVSLSFQVGEGEPLNHLRFGVGRRAKALWLSLRSLLANASPDRVAPMTGDEVEIASRDLNVIYINLRGTLDNLAWAACTLAGKHPPASRQVGLFGDAFRRDPDLADLAKAMSPFKAWSKDLALRRDPAAHRIPLSVAPALLDPADRAKYRELEALYNARRQEVVEMHSGGSRDVEALAAAISRSDAAFDMLSEVGRFEPIFFHHYKDGHLPVYPTVPEDLATLTKVSAIAFDYIRNHAKVEGS